jgi:hypothetical protein
MHADLLGSSVMATVQTGAAQQDIEFGPWGEKLASYGSVDERFAGMPIKVTAKDAHFLSGFNTQIVAAESK